MLRKNWLWLYAVLAVALVVSVFALLRSSTGQPASDRSVIDSSSPQNSTLSPSAPLQHQNFSSNLGKADAATARQALDHIRSTEETAALAKQLEQKDPDIQRAAIAKLMQSGEGKGVVAERFLDLSSGARADAETIANRGDDDLKTRLAREVSRGLASPVVETRLQAVRSLKALKINPDVAEFSAFLLKESDPIVAGEAIDLAGATKQKEFHETLLKLARGAQSGMVRRRALENLIMTGGRDDESVLQIACAALSDSDGEARLGAVVALAYRPFETLPADVKAKIRVMAKNDTYTLKDSSVFPIQDAAKTMLLAAGELKDK